MYQNSFMKVKKTIEGALSKNFDYITMKEWRAKENSKSKESPICIVNSNSTSQPKSTQK